MCGIFVFIYAYIGHFWVRIKNKTGRTAMQRIYSGWYAGIFFLFCDDASKNTKVQDKPQCNKKCNKKNIFFNSYRFEEVVSLVCRGAVVFFGFLLARARAACLKSIIVKYLFSGGRTIFNLRQHYLPRKYTWSTLVWMPTILKINQL